jgi:hypothetical protein
MLSGIIPPWPIIECLLRIAVDPVFPPPLWGYNRRHLLQDKYWESNRFEVIFDEAEASGRLLGRLGKESTEMPVGMDEIDEMEEEYDRSEGSDDEAD